MPIFLDLKFHDIPNIVAGAVRPVLPPQPAMLTVHASGGAAMVVAAKEAASRSAPPPLILAVTLLTNLDRTALRTIGVDEAPEDQVIHLTRMAVTNELVVPGIRPADAARDEQARTMIPVHAVKAGTDWIVVGRPITSRADPAAVASSIAAEIA